MTRRFRALNAASSDGRYRRYRPAPWLETGPNVPLAATGLHAHADTLRYRLGGIRQTAAPDLDDPDQRLASRLELRLLADLR
ncbi:MAG: helix-turn-helix domain-containing protein [Solirubrobacteraceae bacterium]